MSDKQSKNWVGALGRMLVAFALVYSQSAWARQNQKTKDKADSLQKAAAQQAGEKPSSPGESRTSSRGPQEGIRVHGHWAIEVRNPDGTVVTHREFENALAPSGANSLGAVLSRGGSVGFWKITLSDPFSAGPCFNSATNKGILCEIIEPGWVSGAQAGSTFSYQSPTLTVSSVGSNPAQLVLSGTAVASQSDTIIGVSTYSNVCGATVAPSNPCANTPQGTFTFAGLGNNPVSVTPGQTVAVTVTISFS